MTSGSKAATRTFALTVAYDGTGYGGWQRQINASSIQESLEDALAAALGHPCPTLASGRTDAGVHAIGQVVRMRSDRWRHTAEKLIPAINRHLPPQIAVQRARDAAAVFHPIRDAVEKTYRYNIRLSRSPDPFDCRTSWFMPRPIDIDSLRAAASLLEGRHDFSAFESLGSPRVSRVRTMRRVQIRELPGRRGSNLRIDMTANGFLYNMARAIAGSLVLVAARGGGGPERMQEILQGRSRRLAGQTAPACGLCLLRVRYPAAVFLGEEK